MAPKTAKAKKATEVSEAPKKGRGKAKNVEEAEPEVGEDINEKEVAPITEKKKRGKKAAGDTNGVEENGKAEEAVPPAKKGRKKDVEAPVAEDKNEEKSDSNADQSGEDEAPHVDDDAEANGDSKETQSVSAGRGRKKPAKKETAPKAEAKPSRPRKAKETEPEKAVEVEEKPKPAAKGRGRKAQPKVEQEAEEDKEGEDAKAELPPTKGRKKAQPKPVKEKTPESELEAEDNESQENEEEPQTKKDTKGKKNQGKKVPIKEDIEEKDEDVEEAPAKKRKVNKKEEKGKGDSKDEEVTEDAPEPKPKGRGRGKKAAEPPTEADDDAQEAGEATSKRRRKLADDKAPVDNKKPPKNKAVTNYEVLDFANASKNPEGKDWNFKIASWNVDGIRAWMIKGGLDYLTYEKPDILCLQETKCAKDKLPEELANLAGYHAYWENSEKDGYAGVGIYTTQLAMNVQYGLQNEELDSEGRIITAEYEQFYLICTYVPNSGKKLVTLPKRLQWNEEFRKFVKELDKKKPVIICGDMNVSHLEIDLANPKTNRKNAGFTQEERDGMTELLGDGFIDTFRHLYPEKTGAYTFWTYMMNSRAKNVGWRLDYCIISERLLPALCDNVIRDQVYGSDHCPISLFLHLKGADKPKE